MAKLAELLQTADWKKEKHVPVVDLPDSAGSDEKIKVSASVGKEIAHPNTTEHHINWIELYFLPEAGKFPYLLGRYDFSAHGASTEGPDTSGVYSDPQLTATFRTGKSGTVIAKSYCNIHGLWTSEAELKIQ